MKPTIPTREKKKRFLKAYAQFGIIKNAAEAAGIDRCTYYEWKKKDPDFAAALELAQEDAADALEEEARRRGIAVSDTLLIFLLKGAKPEKYKDRIAQEQSGGLEIVVKYEDAEPFAPNASSRTAAGDSGGEAI